jgi:hypothetical protein
MTGTRLVFRPPRRRSRPGPPAPPDGVSGPQEEFIDDVKGRMPLRRDEDATITRDDDETPLGRCRVRAWLEPPQPDRAARYDIRVSDARWERRVGPVGDRRYALRFADGYALVVQLGVLPFDDRANLQGLLGPGSVRIQ